MESRSNLSELRMEGFGVEALDTNMQESVKQGVKSRQHSM